MIKSIGKYRWTICSLLFFATTINYLDRQVLSLLKPLEINKIKTGIHFAFLVLLQDYGNDPLDYSGSRGLFFCM